MDYTFLQREGMGTAGEDSFPVAQPRSQPRSWPVRVAEAGIVVAAVAAYSDTFSNRFVFLDVADIVDNPTIRHLGSLGRVLSPPAAGGLTVGGRPVVNLTLAINYALGGTGVWGYHAVNLLIHILAGLTLFGIVRRTLVGIAKSRMGYRPTGDRGPLAPLGQAVFSAEAPAMADPSAEASAKADAPQLNSRISPLVFAFCVALLWTLHPLQTESVSYVVQRAEALMGLFYLLTLYCFIRFVDGDGGRRSRVASSAWAGLSIFFCFLGMGTKEVMVSAPVIVFLYDRTFVSGSFAEAWCKRKSVYLGLGCTWILLGILVFRSGERGGTAGFGIGVSWWTYVLTQFPAVLNYLRLAVWPHPLIFDYATQWVTNGWEVAPAAAVVVGLGLGSLYLLFFGTGAGCFSLIGLSGGRGRFRLRQGFGGPVLLRRGFGGRALLSEGFERPVRRSLGEGGQVVGFLGTFFFSILAPTSLIPGASQTMAEHRMYLALAPIAVGIVWGLAGLGGGVTRRSGGRGAVPLTLATVLALGLALGLIAARRNRDYRSNLVLWADTMVERPDSARAHFNVGVALDEAGKSAAGIGELERAIELNPSYPEAYDALGIALMKGGRLPEAIADFRTAMRMKPNLPDPHFNLGTAFAQSGRYSDAMAELQEALRLKPEYPVAEDNLGVALVKMGRVREGIAHYERALELKPDDAKIWYDFGTALVAIGETAGAIARFEQALRLKPDFSEAHSNLGVVLANSGRLPDAITHFQQAARLNPDSVNAHYNLAGALTSAGRFPEAILEYERVLRLKPDYSDAHYNLGLALRATGRIAEAEAQFDQADHLSSSPAAGQN